MMEGELEKERQAVDGAWAQEAADYYKDYYSTLDTYGTNGAGMFALKARSQVQTQGPSMCEQVMEKLRYTVFNNRDLLALCFDDEQSYKAYYDSKFESYIVSKS